MFLYSVLASAGTLLGIICTARDHKPSLTATATSLSEHSIRPTVELMSDKYYTSSAAGYLSAVNSPKKLRRAEIVAKFC